MTNTALVPLSPYWNRNVRIDEVTTSWKLRMVNGSGDLLDIISIDTTYEVLYVRDSRGREFPMDFSWRGTHWNLFATPDTLPGLR